MQQRDNPTFFCDETCVLGWVFIGKCWIVKHFAVAVSGPLEQILARFESEQNAAVSLPVKVTLSSETHISSSPSPRPLGVLRSESHPLLGNVRLSFGGTMSRDTHQASRSYHNGRKRWDFHLFCQRRDGLAYYPNVQGCGGKTTGSTALYSYYCQQSINALHCALNVYVLLLDMWVISEATK